MFIRLTPDMSVAAQIVPDDCARAAGAGFVVMICNRPDDEDAGQPSAAVMRAAAEAAGMRYVHIPVDAAGIDEAQIAAMADELGGAVGRGPVLAYCRSGTRSTNLWALAAATRGGDAATIVAAAAGGGYNVSGMLPVLRGLAAKSAAGA